VKTSKIFPERSKMRMTISRSKAWTALAVGAFVAPTVLGAQDSTTNKPAASAAAAQQQQQAATRTHTVKAGDTLWDLARTYLGDPFLWPEIYRLNTDVVEDPHWIYPGERLHVPGAEGAPTVVAGDDDQSRLAPTTFSRTMGRSGESSGRLSLVGRTPRPLVRAGEYYAAPYVEREGGPSGAGQIVTSADMPGIAQMTERTRLQIHDRVLIAPPAGVVPITGARYMSYTLGEVLPGVGQVVVPTGVVEVDSEPRGGELTRARVVNAYEPVLMGQGLIRIDSVSFPAGTQPTSIDLGMDAKVVWLHGGNVLPSIHEYLVLDRTSRDGVHPGDQFTLFRPRTRTETGQLLPAEPIAIAQVVRVTPYATTAMVLGQTQPAIRQGLSARMTAKVQ
jgi:LysM repeat protein